MAKRWKESVYEFAKAEVLEAGREEGRKKTGNVPWNKGDNVRENMPFPALWFMR